MTSTTGESVVVSRRIGAPAGDIFRILADPGRHADLDGSGMLRGGVSGAVVSGVGDVFVMRMHYERYGDDEMHNHVVEYEPDRRIGWEPRPVAGTPTPPRPGPRGATGGSSTWSRTGPGRRS
ncbi:hypothetical protein [Streptomyces capitiformicae]|uniref:Polyketide cyclase n=1 Tax=Streptomyces capitiformicae TaxID=2014920 RepID=A0A919DNJ4_9ACTN|nr:hypothetical protein [Streptomyces capitiformicae]GHE60008.1 hypothetical protein GCM10017771_83080 [Streptomyces capitiformicae]